MCKPEISPSSQWKLYIKAGSGLRKPYICWLLRYICVDNMLFMAITNKLLNINLKKYTWKINKNPF